MHLLFKLNYSELVLAGDLNWIGLSQFLIILNLSVILCGQ